MRAPITWTNTAFVVFVFALFSLALHVNAYAESEAKSIFSQATRYAKLGNHSEAARLYQINVDRYKEPFSATNLALYYLNGRGVPQDSEKAIYLLKLSIAYGSNKVFKRPGTNETTLGWTYITGARPNVPKNPDEARKWTLEAVRYGHPNAHGNLALMYATGFGVEKDYFAALAQLKFAIARYADDLNWVIEDSEEPEWIVAINSEDPIIGQARRFFWSALRTGEKELFIHKITELQVELLERQNTGKGTNGSTKPGSNTSLGTGFLIREDGILATNAHVVESCERVVINTGKGPLPATLVNIDPTQDIAFLKINNYRVEKVLTLSTSNPKLGEDVLVAGFPFGRTISSEVKLTKGIVSALVGIGDNRAELQIDAAVQPGNSGGPILDTSGNVIAMTSSKVDGEASARFLGTSAENISFGIKARVILGHLADLNLSVPDLKSDVVTQEEIIDIVTSTVLRIDCRSP